MRKLVYHVAASLDGAIAEADGSFGSFLIPGEHNPDYLATLRTYDAVLMGRGTYEVGLKQGITNPYPWMKSYVFSRSMTESPDANVDLVRDDAAGFVASLKQQTGGDIYLCGGGELASDLMEAGLIDEIVLKLNPLLIGPGIPLFRRIRGPVRLELTGSKIYASGVTRLTYAVRDARQKA